tara:strand:+ start:93 stop:263 length:171 start_codon:yes stop_codon:yes gene_type:complete
MSYQVKIELEFEDKPTDEDIWNVLEVFVLRQSTDFTVIPPFEDPFDDPKARSGGYV